MNPVDPTKSIADNWQRLQERLHRAAAAASRDLGEIEVIAVTKTRSPREIAAPVAAGARHVGESRIQEAAAKNPEVQTPAMWHFVGHLQRNKAGAAIELFDLIQSVNNERLGAALDRRAVQCSHRLAALVQVNTSGAEAQSGVSAPGLLDLVERLTAYSNLHLQGLMTIAEHTEDEASRRRCFATLRALAEQVVAAGFEGVEMKHLSMCMSADFEEAIAEGATMLRVGTAIFGSRI